MVIHHIDMVILDIDMGYGLMIWEMTVSIWSSSISIWDFLSPCLGGERARLAMDEGQMDTARHVTRCQSNSATRVKNNVNEMAGRHSNHVTRCRYTQDTRVTNEVDDVAGAGIVN